MLFQHFLHLIHGSRSFIFYVGEVSHGLLEILLMQPTRTIREVVHELSVVQRTKKVVAWNPEDVQVSSSRKQSLWDIQMSSDSLSLQFNCAFEISAIYPKMLFQLVCFSQQFRSHASCLSIRFRRIIGVLSSPLPCRYENRDENCDDASDGLDPSRSILLKSNLTGVGQHPKSRGETEGNQRDVKSNVKPAQVFVDGKLFAHPIDALLNSATVHHPFPHTAEWSPKIHAVLLLVGCKRIVTPTMQGEGFLCAP